LIDGYTLYVTHYGEYGYTHGHFQVSQGKLAGQLVNVLRNKI